MPNRLSPDDRGFSTAALDRFFSPEHQQIYVSMLMDRGGLTRTRARYFVRLWAYLLLKQLQDETGRSPQPLMDLYPPEAAITCTHREASELFYGGQERGSDRAAGLMIDRFVALGLLEKRFDGQTLCLKVRTIPELAMPARPPEPTEFQMDAFNARTDAIPIASLLTRTYAELIKDPALASHKIVRSLRQWSQAYPQGMRVLRRSDNLNPVGIAVLYPVASQSESYFFQPPSKSFYLTTDNDVDPFQMASSGDPNCTSVYVRAWVLDMDYVSGANLFRLLQDTKQTLGQMQADFPNLCDLYSLVVHPLYEELRQVIGFQKTIQDTQRSYHWIYLALDRFLEVDIQQALSTLKAKSS